MAVVILKKDMLVAKKLLRNDFGALLKKRRKQVGFKTQQSLADRLGIQQASVARWESGVFFPDEIHFKDLCYLLGVKPEFFHIPVPHLISCEIVRRLDGVLDSIHSIDRKIEKWIGVS